MSNIWLYLINSILRFSWSELYLGKETIHNWCSKLAKRDIRSVHELLIIDQNATDDGIHYFSNATQLNLNRCKFS